MRRQRISRILELREMLLSFQTCFDLVSAGVVFATLESISGFELSSVITEPMYLKLVTVSSFDLTVDATGGVCHQLSLLGTDVHAVGCGGFAECRDIQLILPVLLHLLLSHRGHQQSGDW